MSLLRILVDSFADDGQTNAQMANAREIVSRLDPSRFHVSLFAEGRPDPRIAARPNTRVIALPRRMQTRTMLTEFLFGRHVILFYMKASPASLWFTRLRRLAVARCATVATVESQSDWASEPTISAANIRLIERTVLRCDCLFSNSVCVQQSLKENYGLPSEIIPTGVDTSFFAPAPDGPANSNIRVIFVGSLRPFKGPHAVVEAARRLPHLEFSLIGDGPMRAALETAARDLHNLHLLGPLPPTAVRDQLRQSDIFLFPSRWEGFPKVIMEAAACGLPVVARGDYQPETVIDGQTGFLAADDEELFARVSQLAASSDLRGSMGAAARAHMLQFDWTPITRRWEDAFLRIAAALREGRP
jgi:glycosyltransferase involved in cell wall biosynthesis